MSGKHCGLSTTLCGAQSSEGRLWRTKQVVLGPGQLSFKSWLCPRAAGRPQVLTWCSTNSLLNSTAVILPILCSICVFLINLQTPLQVNLVKQWVQFFIWKSLESAYFLYVSRLLWMFCSVLKFRRILSETVSEGWRKIILKTQLINRFY